MKKSIVTVVMMFLISCSGLIYGTNDAWADGVGSVGPYSEEDSLWVRSFGQLDCDMSCKYNDYRNGGYYTGYYRGDRRRLYVCAYNHGGKGYRPGYNSEGEGACSVGTGGNSYRTTHKYCLCNPPASSDIVMDLFNNQNTRDDCKATCLAEGWSPVTTGEYNNRASFYVCAVNAWGKGVRSGYNLQGDSRCVTGSGGTSVYRSSNKSCLCSSQKNR